MAARMSVEERRARLVDAAIRVMSRDGVPAATTRAIVAEAGMQVSVFHYCFRSKEELVLEVMRVLNERSFTLVADALAARPEPRGMIGAALDTYWQHVLEDPEVHQVTYELTQHALRTRGAEGAAHAQYDAYLEAMSGLLASAAETAGFTWRTPVDVLSRYVLAVVEGVTFQWLVNRDDRSARAVLDALADHLARDAGLAPS